MLFALTQSLRSHLKQTTEKLRVYVDKITVNGNKNVHGPSLLLDSVTKGLAEWDAMNGRSSPEKAAFLRYRPDLLIAALTSFSWEWDPENPAGRVSGTLQVVQVVLPFITSHKTSLSPHTGANCSSRFKPLLRLMMYGAR